MKKILFTLVTMLLPMVAWAAMTQVPVPTAIPTATPALKKCDSNGDGIVNVADIVEVANYIMGNPGSRWDWQSLGQVLGYDGCYDSGTCPHGYTAIQSII